MKPLLVLLDPYSGKEGSSIPSLIKTTNSPAGSFICIHFVVFVKSSLLCDPKLSCWALEYGTELGWGREVPCLHCSAQQGSSGFWDTSVPSCPDSVMVCSALLDILGFPVSGTMLTRNLYNLAVTAHALEVDTITHFADRDSKAQRTMLCQARQLGYQEAMHGPELWCSVCRDLSELLLPRPMAAAPPTWPLCPC